MFILLYLFSSSFAFKCLFFCILSLLSPLHSHTSSSHSLKQKHALAISPRSKQKELQSLYISTFSTHYSLNHLSSSHNYHFTLPRTIISFLYILHKYHLCQSTPLPAFTSQASPLFQLFLCFIALAFFPIIVYLSILVHFAYYLYSFTPTCTLYFHSYIHFIRHHTNILLFHSEPKASIYLAPATSIHHFLTFISV